MKKSTKSLAAKKRRKYDDAFKQQALQMMQSVPTIALTLGMGQSLLYKWKQAQRPAALDQELEQLRSKLKQVENEQDILKKSLEHFLPSDVAQAYAFIAAQTAQHAVTDLCQTLGSSRSGYYAWQQRPAPTDALTPQVTQAFWRHARRYGSRRLTAELQAEQHAIGRRRIRRIMRAENLRAIQPKSFVPRTTNFKHGGSMSLNLMNSVRITVESARAICGSSDLHAKAVNAGNARPATKSSPKLAGLSFTASIMAKKRLSNVSRCWPTETRSLPSIKGIKEETVSAWLTEFRSPDGADRTGAAAGSQDEPRATGRPVDLRRSQGRKKGLPEEDERGTFWRGTALETETRLRVGRAIAKTEEEVAPELMKQIKERGHQQAPPAIATDGKGAYREAMVET